MSAARPLLGDVKKWIGRIEAAKGRKAEKDFRSRGREIQRIYEADKDEEVPFNILFSNTETLAPAIYSTTPRPSVKRRYKDADPLGKAVSDASQRGLIFLMDTNGDEYAPFDDSMQDAVLDALVPGRGITRFRYEAEVVEMAEGKSAVNYETVCSEPVEWDKLIMGWARKWCDVPWIAFELDMTKSDARKHFPTEVVAGMTFSIPEDEEEKGEGKSEGDVDKTPTARVYEIWDKKGKQVLWLSEHYPEKVLKQEGDELNLTGFFPIPRPLQFIRKTKTLTPTPLYAAYEAQARELNEVTRRLKRVIQAIKVRGGYAGQFSDLAEILKGEDNQLVPIENAALMDGGKLDNLIWLMPIEKLIVVVQQLVLQRNQIKQVIYEITGISDILRGATNASETLGAQQIKTQWGTMRLKRMQKVVSVYARDCLRIMLEIAGTKFGEQTWVQMTGLEYATKQEVEGAQAVIQAAQQMGQPPDPQAMATLAKPRWEMVLAALKSDTMRQYRVDVETNSTTDADTQEDKKDIAELMNAISQFLNGVAPLIQEGVMPFQAAQAMLMAIVRRYQWGEEAEDYIRQMQPPKPQDDGKAKAEAEMAKVRDAQMKLKEEALGHTVEATKREMDLAKREAELENQKQTAGLDAQKAMMDLQREAEKMLAEARKVAAEVELKVKTHQSQVALDKKERQVDEKALSAAPAGGSEGGKSGSSGDRVTGQVMAMHRDMVGQITAMAEKIVEVLAAPREMTAERGPGGRILKTTSTLKAVK